MAETSKGKSRLEQLARDWRYWVVNQTGGAHPTENQINAIELPFELTPETHVAIPDEYTQHLQYILTGGITPVPWDGYYAIHNGAHLAVANAYGVWFEIRKRENT
jgi:hypothetical protein